MYYDGTLCDVHSPKVTALEAMPVQPLAPVTVQCPKVTALEAMPVQPLAPVTVQCTMMEPCVTCVPSRELTVPMEVL
jgi:hypothetical protein